MAEERFKEFITDTRNDDAGSDTKMSSSEEEEKGRGGEGRGRRRLARMQRKHPADERGSPRRRGKMRSPMARIGNRRMILRCQAIRNTCLVERLSSDEKRE